MNNSTTSSYNIGSINVNAISNGNKLAALRSFVRLMEFDIILLQEVECVNLCFPGYNVITNVDNTKRGTAIALKSHITYSNIQRSLNTRILSVKIGGSVTICNVYAPSGTQNFSARENLIKEQLPFYLQSASEHLILGGDFNCVIATKDSTGSSNYSPSLKQLVDNLQIKDTWDCMNQNVIDYSFVRPNSASRLDRIYISRSLVPHLRTSELFATAFSDHKAYKIRCCLPSLGRPHGRGYWSIRAHILNEANLEEFEQKWSRWLRERRNHNSWMSWWIEFAKPKIRSFFKWKTNEAFREFHAKNELLYRQLRDAYDRMYQNPGGTTTVNKVKAEMLRTQSNFSKAYERLNDRFVSGEKVSSFQIGDRYRRKTNISTIRHQERILTDATDIENHVQNFFKDLYTSEELPGNENFPMNRIIPPDSITNNAMMEAITTTELFFAIKESASRKSPGNDGIPKEFYLKAFDIIHPQLNLIINEALQGNIPEKFVEGVIVLCKKKTDDQTIKAYRPISLLNYDYKLLSRILKKRLEKVMVENNLLNSNQKCSNSDRNIFEAILAIKDRIAELNCKRKRGKLISFDFDHAFDRVNIDYLMVVMRNIHLNPNFVQLLGKIMSSSHSRLLINGNLTPQFPIQRSVRQGDPISMHLFVLYLHPLLERLRTICNDPLDLLVAYADDISIIVVDDRKLGAIQQTFLEFGRCSGSLLNLGKTFAVNIGPQWNVDVTVWPTVRDSVKILGVTFLNSQKQTIDFNWGDVIRKTSRLMWMYKSRNLTLHQKIIVLNTFITSKLWFLASVVSISNQAVARLTSYIGSFIWERFPTRVPVEQLTLPRNCGGLNLHLPMHKSKALLATRFLKELEQTPFASSFGHNLENPPNVAAIPTLYPCLKSLTKIVPYIPAQLKDNPSAESIHTFNREQLNKPKIILENPNISWTRVWKNIRQTGFTSKEQSIYYLLVNGKIPHAVLLHRQNRVPNPFCQQCHNIEEDLEHKFAACQRIRALWNHLQSRLETIQGSRMSFTDLRFPELRNSDRRRSYQALKAFIIYVNFVLDANDQLSVEGLDFVLNCSSM